MDAQMIMLTLQAMRKEQQDMAAELTRMATVHARIATIQERRSEFVARHLKHLGPPVGSRGPSR